jgi:hypothetical protein
MGIQVMKYCSSVATVMGEREDRYGSFPGLVLFRLVAPPLQPGVVGSYLVQVLSSPAICHWREPIVSRFLGRNR